MVAALTKTQRDIGIVGSRALLRYFCRKIFQRGRLARGKVWGLQYMWCRINRWCYSGNVNVNLLLRGSNHVIGRGSSHVLLLLASRLGQIEYVNALVVFKQTILNYFRGHSWYTLSPLDMLWVGYHRLLMEVCRDLLRVFLCPVSMNMKWAPWLTAKWSKLTSVGTTQSVPRQCDFKTLSALYQK